MNEFQGLFHNWYGVSIFQISQLVMEELLLIADAPKERYCP